MISYLFQDWTANAGNPKGRFVLVFFRLCQCVRRSRFWWLGLPVLGAYVLLVHWVLGIELDYRMEAGPRLAVHHGVGLVVHWRVKLGADCLLRHGVTIGERQRGGAAPVLEDGVEVGAGALILGGIRIGKGAVVGAGAVVIADVPALTAVAGNPARPVAPLT